MSRVFYIDGPATDGHYVSEDMDLSYASAQVHIDFFDAGGNRVTPTAGTVTVSWTLDGLDYAPFPFGVFDAKDTDRLTRLPPAMSGAARSVRITLSGVTGATKFAAIVVRSINDLATRIPLTAGDENIGRVPVDTGSTGFFAGQEVRFFYEFSIPQGESRWLKVTLPVNVTLSAQNIDVDAGSIRYRAWRGATDVGPWANPASPLSGIFSTNEFASQEYGYTRKTTVQIGGNTAAIAAGTVAEVARVVAASSAAQSTTVSSGVAIERGVLAGTYYLQLENLSNGTSTGVYTFKLEERTGITVY